jgi:glycosyltransferase involved in cell wall biosynthesis
MENKLLIYIVSYQRKSFTQGAIECIYKVKPPNSQIIVCDNGSTDGTREWLEDNQEKYELGLIFPDENLRVPGAWKLITNYYKEDEFDYILPLDNDCWILPDPTWFEQCLEIFNSDPKICSLGIHKERKPGTIVFERQKDPSYDNKKPFNDNLEYYDTVLYAGARIDKFSIFHTVMRYWPHKFIGDKIGRSYNSLGYRTVKITPGFIIDISECNFNNEEHEEYNRWFFDKERDGRNGPAYKHKYSGSLDKPQSEDFVMKNFGENYIKFL